MKEIFISPSVMCCDIIDTHEFIKAFEEKKVKNIHFDVMDGHYVNNIMLGVNFYNSLKKMTNLPIDIHLMCLQPEKFLKYFKPDSGDWVSFHPETTNHPHRLLQEIKDLGCRSGIVLNPGTPLDYINEVSDLIDYILVMAVDPGFAGQKMVESHIEKLQRIKDIVDNINHDIDIIIDGNTTIENATKMVNAGANGLVVGTSSLLKSVKHFTYEYDAYILSVKG